MTTTTKREQLRAILSQWFEVDSATFGVVFSAIEPLLERLPPHATPPENDHVPQMYMHCGLCLQEPLPVGESRASWARLSVAWTERGFQVWCERHDVNVMHVDFEGHCHPANLTRLDNRPSRH